MNNANNANKVSVKVEHMQSPRGNRDVPNQFIIRTEQGVFFQSYKSIIAFVPFGEGKTLLDETYWNYSTTTSKYRNNFLRESTKETKEKIKSGVYELANLN